MSLVQATTALRFIERTVTVQVEYTDALSINHPAVTKRVRILQQSFRIADTGNNKMTHEWRDVPLESE